MLADGDGESADKDLSSKTAHLLVRSTTDACDDGVIATPSRGMVEGVATGEEYFCELFIVIGHHGRTGCFLCHSEKVMDIFDRTESLLPELKLDRGIKLCKSCIEVVLQDLWVG